MTLGDSWARFNSWFIASTALSARRVRYKFPSLKIAAMRRPWPALRHGLLLTGAGKLALG
ncbi:hypothetical protein FHS72_001431 [Loktanella ponticola]|uniref:Uncharacterized protein n=1 Tax=Yoonia ponticola TaxID=1524255 RepID=A0A7W9BJU3_9RHOB|nr:hypothetical protein [Yoonia ponticola]